VEIRFAKLAARTGTAYLKAPHKASFYAVVGAAAIVTLAPDGTCQSARLGITGLADRSFRAGSAEAALAGQRLDEATVWAALGSLGEGMEPLSDVYASADYRRHLVRTYAARALLLAVSRAG
jgi:carbon-monoxide dehydrogenase medium subunit